MTENNNILLKTNSDINLIKYDKKELMETFGYFEILEYFPDDNIIGLNEDFNDYKICNILFGDENCKSKEENEIYKIYHDYYDCKYDVKKRLYYTKYCGKSEEHEFLVSFDRYNQTIILSPNIEDVEYEIDRIYVCPDITEKEMVEYKSICEYLYGKGSQGLSSTLANHIHRCDYELQINSHKKKYCNNSLFLTSMIIFDYEDNYSHINNSRFDISTCYSSCAHGGDIYEKLLYLYNQIKNDERQIDTEIKLNRLLELYPNKLKLKFIIRYIE